MKSVFFKLLISYLLFICATLALLSGVNPASSDFAWYLSTLVAAALIAAYLHARRFTGPLKELQSAASKVADGDFTVRLNLVQRDEYQGLRNSFNAMARRLQSSCSDASAQKESLDAVVSSIREGLLVVREDGTVVLCNNAARAAAGVELSEGKPYWETLRNPFIADIIKSCAATRKGSVDEAEINGRQYLVSTTYSTMRNEVVVVIFDVTNIKNFEIMKKEFVTNVSHELMTPLTAIRGFVETMRDATKRESGQYLDIIDKHTERLTRIVSDLLSLSKMQEKGFQLDLQPLDLAKVVSAVAKLFEGRAKDKNLVMTVNTGKEPLMARGDQFRLEQALINLIDNAIKYTDNGSIAVTLTGEGANAVIQVCDTGIGIPKNHLGRIFERFYVVDKSRSRQSGGTGLGLSIVKHTILLHNGSVDVNNPSDGGTCFTVTLPLLRR
jgi:two-component system phosphate regulon sensor histidine kinase PhoR